MSFTNIDSKWQKKWDDSGIFRSSEKHKGKKFYVLEMFAYPSGKIHMGHVRNYTIGDSYARFKRMQGYNVLYPIGFDSFGLPAENAAIKGGEHPKKWTENCIENMKKQLKVLGFSYDWNRLVETYKDDYYKWNQWLFLQMYKKGLAYRKESSVNWCHGCKTVLANEQVVDGKCWRCKSEVGEKRLEQWFFSITKYADRLLKDLKKLKGWPERVKVMQENWIGKSQGVEIFFTIKDNTKESGKKISTFTTRPDTVYGITYLVFAPEHPMVMSLVKGTKYEERVRKFIKDVKRESLKDRLDETKEKKGIFIGKYFINPVTKTEHPIYIANYAIMEYGTGVVMCVPAHDQRDFEFAKKNKIPLKIVIQNPQKNLKPETMTEAYSDIGLMVNSGKFNNLSSNEALPEMAKWLDKQRFGKRRVEFRLRDWLI